MMRTIDELGQVDWLKEESSELKRDENKCNAKTEVYSRVVGFYRPVGQWNKGKSEEFKDRQEYEM